MADTYTSFLLRCWQVAGGRRIKIEHIQSGAGTQAASLAAALVWMETCCGEMLGVGAAALADPNAARAASRPAEHAGRDQSPRS